MSQQAVAWQRQKSSFRYRFFSFERKTFGFNFVVVIFVFHWNCSYLENCHYYYFLLLKNITKQQKHVILSIGKTTKLKQKNVKRTQMMIQKIEINGKPTNKQTNRQNWLHYINLVIKKWMQYILAFGIIRISYFIIHYNYIHIKYKLMPVSIPYIYMLRFTFIIHNFNLSLV